MTDTAQTSTAGHKHTAIDGEIDGIVQLGCVRVVLVGTTHPGNIGAAARAMKTMGLNELVLVRPRHFPHADATARASGADDLLTTARVVDTLAEAVESCPYVVGTSARPRHLRWPEVDAREFATTVTAQHATAAVAVVFGRENSGLSNEELDCCQAVLRLPANPAYSSLNLAAAVQLVAYELRMAAVYRQRSSAPDVEPLEALQVVAADAVTQGEMEGMFVHLETALVDIGYFDPRSPKLLRRRLRRMFNKMAPDRSELNILRGIFGAAQRAARRTPRGD
jgi:tRNA (cytidine32/uridine32-2'-O)-methyltransferase